MPQDDAKAGQPSKRKDANDIHGEVRTLSPECNAVRVVAGKRAPRGNGVVGTWVSSGKEDFTPIAALETCACDAGDIVPPSDVEDPVRVGRVAGHRTGVNGSFGA